MIPISFTEGYHLDLSLHLPSHMIHFLQHPPTHFPLILQYHILHIAPAPLYSHTSSANTSESGTLYPIPDFGYYHTHIASATTQSLGIIGQGEERNITLTIVIYISMCNLKLLTCPLIISSLKVVEKGVSLSLNIKNISFQQLVN